MSENNLPLEEDMGYEPDLVTLENETGEEFTFEVVDAMDFNNTRYLAMVPYEEDPAARLEQDAEMIIMRVEEEEGEEVLLVVEDSQELNATAKEFLKRLEDVYDIDLDELEG